MTAPRIELDSPHLNRRNQRKALLRWLATAAIAIALAACQLLPHVAGGR